MTQQIAKKPAVIIFGAGRHALVVLDILNEAGQYDVIGFFDDYTQGKCYGKDVLGTVDKLGSFLDNNAIVGGVIAIGDNAHRRETAEKIREVAPKFNFITAIHPSAVVAENTSISPGCIIAAGAVVGPGAHIAEHGLINTLAGVDHDCQLGPFVSIGPGASLGGGVHIGAGTAVGLGASVIHKITIGKNTVIGAGAVVVKPVPDLVVAYGNPAKVIRQRQYGGKYL